MTKEAMIKDLRKRIKKLSLTKWDDDSEALSAISLAITALIALEESVSGYVNTGGR